MRKFWNGRWGRLSRRDIWVRRRPSWVVEARAGDSDSPTKRWEFDDEDEALAWVKKLMATGGDGWKDTTSLYQRDRGDGVQNPDTSS